MTQRTKYTEDHKHQAVELLESIETSAADRSSEISHLKQENRRLKKELEILKRQNGCREQLFLILSR